MLSDTTLDWFIRRWQRAVTEHEALGFSPVNICWKIMKQLPQGAAQKGGDPVEDDEAEVRVFVSALRKLHSDDREAHRAFMAKYISVFDGVTERNLRKDKEKAARLGVPTSTFSRRVRGARDRLKAQIEEIWYS